MSGREYRLSPKAISDLQTIWNHLAPLNERAADAILENIHRKLVVAIDFPLTGSPRPALGPTARILVEGQYIIVYEPAEYGLYVVTIVHGRRQPSNWL